MNLSDEIFDKYPRLNRVEKRQKASLTFSQFATRKQL